MLACCPSQSRENALEQNGEGYSVGIPPLRATGFSKTKNFSGAPVGMTDAQDPETNRLVVLHYLTTTSKRRIAWELQIGQAHPVQDQLVSAHRRGRREVLCGR